MTNIKQVYIAGKIPFDWAEKLSGKEARTIASWFLTPSTGTTLTYHGEAGGVKNKCGGITTYYWIIISGREAIPIPALKIIRKILEVHKAELDDAKYRDVENNSGWFEIKKEE